MKKGETYTDAYSMWIFPIRRWYLQSRKILKITDKKVISKKFNSGTEGPVYGQ